MTGKEKLLEEAQDILKRVGELLKRGDPHLTPKDIAALLIAPTPDHHEEAARALVDGALRALSQGVSGPGRQAALARAYLAGVRTAWEEHARLKEAVREALGEGWHPGFYWVVLLWDGTSFALPEPFPEGELLAPEEVEVVARPKGAGEEILPVFAQEQAALATLLARALAAYRGGGELGPEEARALSSLRKLFGRNLEDLLLLLFLPSVLTPEREAREILAATVSALDQLAPGKREEGLNFLASLLPEAPPTPDVLRVAGLFPGEVLLVDLPVTEKP